MNWSVCAALVALVTASYSFSASEAKQWGCHAPESPWAENVPTCLFEAKVNDFDIKGLLQWFQSLDDVTIQWLIDQILPDADIEDIKEMVSVILSLFCTDADRLGGKSAIFQFDDNVQPICHTLLYVVEYSEADLSVRARLKVLSRGPWGANDSLIDVPMNNDCYSMCTLFRDNGTVSIEGLRARASYLGCWLEENQNAEEIKPSMEVNVIDCERYHPTEPTTPQAPPTQPPTTTRSGDGGSGGGRGDNGGGSSPVVWILVGVVSLAIVVIVVGAAAYWFFKIRTASASTPAEHFSPSVELSKV